MTTTRLTKWTPEKKAIEAGAPCQRCGHCCQFSSGLMREGEDARIAEYLGIPLQRLRDEYLEETVQFNQKIQRPKLIRKGMPYGRCIFYEDGCSIQEVKPLHCRVCNCGELGEQLTEWFYVNHVVDIDDENSLREWHIRTQTRVSLKGAHISEMEDVPEHIAKKVKEE